MADILFLFTFVNMTSRCNLNINVFCPKMYNSLSDRLLDSYLCSTLNAIIVSAESEKLVMMNQHIEMLKEPMFDEETKPRINYVLECIVYEIMEKQLEKIGTKLIPKAVEIFGNKYFDDKTWNEYIRRMRSYQKDENQTEECIYNFVCFVEITREQKISFLNCIYEFERRCKSKFPGSFDNIDFDNWNEKFAEIISLINETNFEQMGVLNVCFHLDMSELVSLYMNEVDAILVDMFSSSTVDCTKTKLEKIISEANNNVLSSYIRTGFTKLTSIPAATNIKEIIVSCTCFFASSPEYVQSFLRYENQRYRQTIEKALHTNMKILCNDFGNEFIEHIKSLAYPTKDQSKKLSTVVVVAQRITNIF